MTTQKLCGRVNNDVGPQVEGATQDRCCESRVDHQGNARIMRNLRNDWDVQDLETWIADRLPKDQPRVRPDRSAELLWSAWVNKRCLNAETRKRVRHQIVGPAVDRLGRDNVVTRTEDCCDAEVGCGLPTRGSNGPDTSFECRDPFLKDSVRRVAQPRIDMTGSLDIEDRGGLVGVVKNVRSRLIYGRSPRSGF